MIRFSLLLILSIGAFSAWSQDTLHSSSPARRLEPTDSITVRNGRKVMTIESYAARFDPRKAMLYSAALPGLGQAYNKKYWKIPLIYGAFGGLGFAVWWNNDRYLFYRAGLFGLLNEPANPTVDPVTNLTKFGNRVVDGVPLFPASATSPPLKEEIVRNAVNRFRRDRDFALIASFIFYMMQMVDAHVDAHLKEFDVNPHLKVSLEPSVQQNAFTGRSAGIGLTLKF